MSEDICVVVPTIRNPGCVREYVTNVRANGFDPARLHFVLVTEDFCDTDAMRSMLEDLGVAGRVFDGTGRDAWFADRGISEYRHLIPKASHAQTSFGLLYLWDGDFEFGMFIDDDTRPVSEFDFFGHHLRNLAFEGELRAVRSNERWVNVLYENHEEHGLYPRGYPYGAMDETIEEGARTVTDVVASQGLWTNVPDLDAVRILMDGDLEGQARTRTSSADFDNRFVAHPGQYLTVCSMNLAFKREIIPAFYQFPMDDNPWDVGRFDDIWSGLTLKRAADVLEKDVLTGPPLCEHNKAPRSTFGDLANEAPGLELNEHVWRVFDRADVAGRITARDPSTAAGAFHAAFAAMADELADGDFSDWANGEFLNYCGEYAQDWLDCLVALDSGRNRIEHGRVTADD